MKDYKERLIAEEREMTERLDKLGRFLDSRKVDNIPPEQHKLLNIQVELMDELVDILRKRIKLDESLGEYTNDF